MRCKDEHCVYFSSVKLKVKYLHIYLTESVFNTKQNGILVLTTVLVFIAETLNLHQKIMYAFYFLNCQLNPTVGTRAKSIESDYNAGQTE